MISLFHGSVSTFPRGAGRQIGMDPEWLPCLLVSYRQPSYLPWGFQGSSLISEDSASNSVSIDRQLLGSARSDISEDVVLRSTESLHCVAHHVVCTVYCHDCCTHPG